MSSHVTHVTLCIVRVYCLFCYSLEAELEKARSAVHRDQLDTADVSFAKAVNLISQMMKSGTLSEHIGKQKHCEIFTEMGKVHMAIGSKKLQKLEHGNKRCGDINSVTEINKKKVDGLRHFVYSSAFFNSAIVRCEDKTLLHELDTELATLDKTMLGYIGQHKAGYNKHVTDNDQINREALTKLREQYSERINTVPLGTFVRETSDSQDELETEFIESVEIYILILTMTLIHI